MPDTEELPRLLSIEQLAEHLGVTPRHVRRLVAEKRVPYLKWRRFIRFDPDEIAAWLDAARQPAAGLAPTGCTRTWLLRPSSFSRRASPKSGSQSQRGTAPESLDRGPLRLVARTAILVAKAQEDSDVP